MCPVDNPSWSAARRDDPWLSGSHSARQREGRLGGRPVPGTPGSQEFLPGLTVHDSVPAPVVKSGNLVGKARPRGWLSGKRRLGRG